MRRARGELPQEAVDRIRLALHERHTTLPCHRCGEQVAVVLYADQPPELEEGYAPCCPLGPDELARMVAARIEAQYWEDIDRRIDAYRLGDL